MRESTMASNNILIEESLDHGDRKRFCSSFHSSIYLNIFKAASIFLLSASAIFSWLYWEKSIGFSVSLPVGLAFGFFITIGSMFSLRFRCTMAICVPQLSTQNGRLILMSVVTGLLVGGPLVSITHNTNQVSSAVSCIPKLAQKHGESLKSAYGQAYYDLTSKIQDSISTWNKLSQGIQTALRPLKSMLTELTTAFETAADAIMNAASKCKSSLSNAHEACSNSISKAYRDCNRKVPFPAVCDIMNVGGVCNTVNTGYCDAIDGTKLETSFLELSNGVEEFKKMYDLNIFLGKGIESNWNSTKDLNEIEESIRNAFNSKFSQIQLVLSCVQYVLIGTILIIPYKSHCYLKHRLMNKGASKNPDSELDYIRKKSLVKQNKESATKIHMKNKERKKNLKSKKTSKESKRQKSEMKIQLILLLTHVLLTATVFAFDYTLYWITSTVEEHGDASFEASGEVTVNLEVTGGDILRPVMQTFLNSFNIDRSYNFTTSTKDCLPNPIKPIGLSLILPIFFIYGFAILLIFSGTKLLWIRHKIFVYFYPEFLSKTPNA